MPAKSDKQQKAAGIALAVKRGKAKAKPGTPSAKMAKSMSEGELSDYAKERKAEKSKPYRGGR